MTYYLILVAVALLAAVSFVVYHQRKSDKEQQRLKASTVLAHSVSSNPITFNSISTRTKQETKQVTNTVTRKTGISAGILIVDDQPSIRMLLSELFRAEGADVYLAEHGYAALEHLKNNDFDCVLLDLKLPEMDGIEVLRAIREKSQAVPVILISAYAEPAKMEEAVRLGVTKFLTKPFDIDELKEDVLKVLQQRPVLPK
ncbi:response regulator [Paenibacillus prosopidis]|uniref:Response regulator receiver domain-containing protein n=1 Tax=Paenibacillus prosopidis TaxID=630520 RepID=A0A368W589_9BACL|nr:response regulator [Paenibacillus prosopidis]RCW50923.1 response regulator receiver domain-containing protein [Paenibacillus prosopidis]